MTGDNGLLQKATTAKQANEEAAALEKIKVEVAGSYGLDGEIDIGQLNINLKRIINLKYKNSSLSDSNKIEEFPVTVELDNNSYQITNDGTVIPIKPQPIGNLTKDNYGDYLDLGQSVVGDSNSTSDDWRIIYNDKNNSYGGTNGARVYAILADYLPKENSAVKASGLHGVDDRIYSVNSEISRDDLLACLNHSTAWQSLISDSLKNSCQVKGAITAEIIMASYNQKYGTNFKYINFPYFRTNPNDNSSDIDNLYVPHPSSSGYFNCQGYWIATLSEYEENRVWDSWCGGCMGDSVYSNISYSTCPIVMLPCDIQVTSTISNGKTIWKVIQ